jgi:hypothetical protein
VLVRALTLKNHYPLSLRADAATFLRRIAREALGHGQRGGGVMDKLFSREAIVRERERSSRFAKITLGVVALVSVALGLSINGLAQPLGIPHETTWPATIALLWTAIVYTCVLCTWNRIFKRRG